MQSIQFIHNRVSWGFSGTGQNGKPKVMAGKAGYTYKEIKPLKTSPNVEFVGMAHDPDTFQQMLAEGKPDVVVIGSTFGMGEPSSQRPSELLRAYAETLPPAQRPGVVYKSSSSPYASDFKLSDGSTLNYTHLNQSTADELAAAIHQVDPTPQNKPLEAEPDTQPLTEQEKDYRDQWDEIGWIGKLEAFAKLFSKPPNS